MADDRIVHGYIDNEDLARARACNRRIRQIFRQIADDRPGAERLAILHLQILSELTAQDDFLERMERLRSQSTRRKPRR